MIRVIKMIPNPDGAKYLHDFKGLSHFIFRKLFYFEDKLHSLFAASLLFSRGLSSKTEGFTHYNIVFLVHKCH